LYNATGGEESDWFSDGDPTVVYDVSFDTVDGYKKVQESLGNQPYKDYCFGLNIKYINLQDTESERK
jgi:hypothetical protein